MQATATLRVSGGEARIVAVGEFDLATASTLASVLEQACAMGLSVTLDLAQVDFIDATAMRSLDWARSRLHAAGHDLTVVHPQPLIARALEIGGFADVVSI